jgi:hypothetical protein
MISADTVVYNNLPIDVPLGNQLMPKATPFADEFDSGIKKKLYQIPVTPFRDTQRTIHSANFCNTYGEILPCYVSPSLNLNRVYADPQPVKLRNAEQPLYGNARNQPVGLGVVPEQIKLFRKKDFIPDQTTAGVDARHFKPISSSM